MGRGQGGGGRGGGGKGGGRQAFRSNVDLSERDRQLGAENAAAILRNEQFARDFDARSAVIRQLAREADIIAARQRELAQRRKR